MYVQNEYLYRMFIDAHHYHRDGREGLYNSALCEDFQGLFSAGFHPMQYTTPPDDSDWENLEKTLNLPGCRAVGECGLDTRSALSYHEQRNIFLRQLALAKEYKLSVVVHCVRSFPGLLSVLKDFPTEEFSVMIHGFAKKSPLMKSLAERGCFLSFGVPLLTNLRLQEVFRECPVQNILIETDEETLPLEQLYTLAASLKQTDICTFANQIKENFYRFIQ